MDEYQLAQLAEIEASFYRYLNDGGDKDRLLSLLRDAIWRIGLSEPARGAR